MNIFDINGYKNNDTVKKLTDNIGGVFAVTESSRRNMARKVDAVRWIAFLTEIGKQLLFPASASESPNTYTP